jgi:septal ring factor EnvC (AmiA/AmiB activator)
MAFTDNARKKINMTTHDIPSWIAFVSSLIALYMAIKKQPHEIRQLDANTDSADADTAEKYQRIANLAAERALGLERRLSQLENEKIQMAIELDKIKAELVAKNEEIATLRDWAERLVHQVQAFGEVPVKLRAKAVTQ